MNKKILLALALLTLIALSAVYYILQLNKAKFDAPRKEGEVIQFRIGKEATLDGVVNNLYYYGFIKDENAFIFALEHTQDDTKGGESFIKVGEGSKTIEREAVYTISQSMTAWELASVLLNKAKLDDCSHGCPGMFYPALVPGGDLAPGAAEIYKWVETYEDCVKANGQLSSEQYYERTGIRTCVTPDGREFTEGQEGSKQSVGG